MFALVCQCLPMFALVCQNSFKNILKFDLNKLNWHEIFSCLDHTKKSIIYLPLIPLQNGTFRVLADVTFVTDYM